MIGEGCMKRPVGTMMAALIFLALGIFSCAKPMAEAEGGPQDIVMTACTACHPTKPICEGLVKKDRDAWNTTVARMVGKGAKVPPGDIPAVVEYLSSLKPGSPPVCK
jgi:hypothetical protein